LPLVGEDVEVGEGVGLGVQIQACVTRSKEAGGGIGRRLCLGIEVELVGVGELRVGFGGRRKKTRAGRRNLGSCSRGRPWRMRHGEEGE